MTMMGELNFILGQQIKKSLHDTSICQEKHIKVLLKKFNMLEANTIDTPWEQTLILTLMN